MGTKVPDSVRGSSVQGKRIKMRISDIHFREVEALDLETLLSNDYKNQYYRDPLTGELSEIDISDWRETLTRLCKNPQVSLWV
jgi:hypothetical protein